MLAALRGHGVKRVLRVEEDVESKSTELPADKDREFDVELGLLTLNG
jgi:hypothetical protein